MKKDVSSKFDEARGLFPHTRKIVYFNTASYGPFSEPVATAIKNNIEVRLESESDDSHDAFGTQDELRADYARLIHADKRQVGIGGNTTFGMNIAAFGLPFKKGDEVLVTDIEFPAGVYVWRGAAEIRGLKLKFVKTVNRCFDIAEFEKSITKRTRALSLSFVQNFNGFKNDLEAIGEICRKHNIYFIVDGIQGMGAEFIDVKKLGIDVFSAGCQKWMLAPQGCGFFYIADHIRDRIKPPFASWMAVEWNMDFTDILKYDLPYFESARKFEMGYYAVLNIMGMKAAAEIFKALGIKNIQKHNHALIDRLAGYIKSNPFYAITSSMEPKHRSSIFTFTCRDYKELCRELLRARIVLVVREGSIRISVHLFNNNDDVDKLIDVLDRFSKRKR